MDVSIIYVNYKTARLIVDSIRSVKEQTSGIEYEIIVVDNDSQDDSIEIIQAQDTQIQIIQSPENVGFGRANNLGVEKAKGKCLFFLNPDTLLKNNAIRILYDYLTTHNEAGACGGNLLDEQSAPTYSFGRNYPSLWYDFLSLFYLKPLLLRHPRSSFYNYTSKPMKVAYITGADLMVKKEIFEIAGGFDPRFFMNFEETELCERIRKKGWNIVSVPEAEIIHLEGKASNSSESRLKRFYEGQYTYHHKRSGNEGIRTLYCLIETKNKLRQFIFSILCSAKKKEYWKTKSKVNKAVYNRFKENA